MRTALCLVFATALLSAQDPPGPRFEVASIKPAAPRTSGRGVSGGPGAADPGQIVYRDIDLRSLVYQAYEVPPFQLSAPSWMEAEHFDIVAKVPPDAAKSDVPLMLRNLLIDRFQLQVHHESREAEAYALTIGKNGARMTEYPLELPDGSVDAVPHTMAGMDKEGFFIFPSGYAGGMMGSYNGRMRIVIARRPMIELCAFLARAVQEPVVDQTGLAGRYDVRLAFTPESDVARPSPSGENEPASAATDPSTSIFHAVESQLGLKLERGKLPVDFLVVDHAARRPSEN